MTPKITGRTVLVTGAGGFIGSHLTRTLLEQGNKVIALDNFSTGYRSNLTPFSSDGNFTLIEGDIRDMDCCRRAVKGADSVLHQAALGSVPRSILEPHHSVSVNVSGFVNVLSAAREAGIRRVVYASSSSVYGDDPTLPKQESRTGNPLSPYAMTKHVNELFAENFARVYGLETIGLRYFNVFGPNQSPEGPYAAVIPRFALRLLRGEAPELYGDGTQSRDFTYIRNVTDANLLAMSAPPEAANAAYNIACGERICLNELFSLLRKEIAKFFPAAADLACVHLAPRAGDIPHSHADISRAKCALGYSPEIDVREGLRLTAEWYCSRAGIF